MQTVEKAGIRFNVEVSDPNSREFWPRFASTEWEPETFQVLDAALKPGGLVLDVGTWIGPITLLSAARGCEVVGYEPDPTAYDILDANLQLNPELRDKVTLKKLAVARATETRRFFAIDAFGHSGASLNEFNGATTSIEIECVDALQELHQHDFNRVCLLKMDIEGAEYEVIPKIAPLIRQYRPPFYLSLHLKDDKSLSKRKPSRSLARFKRGYEISRILNGYKHIYFFENGRWLTKEELPVHNLKTWLKKHIFYGINGSVLLSDSPLF